MSDNLTLPAASAVVRTIEASPGIQTQVMRMDGEVSIDGLVTSNITAAAQTAFIDCARFSSLRLHCSGTFAAANCAFEASLNSTNGTDGNWFTVQAVRTNANTIETTTGSLSAAPAYAWGMSVAGYRFVRVRCTAITSGTQIWALMPGVFAVEPIPASQVSGTQPVSGTVTATVTGGTTLPVTPTTTFTNSAATTNPTSVKASAGTLWSIVASNSGASAVYLKLYNKASAPTVGTDTPALTIQLPASGTVSVGGGANGLRFGTGLALAITAGVADTDTAAVAASAIKVATTFT